MPDILKRIRFTDSLVADVSDFNCGNEPWETEVADWIRCVNPDDNALADAANRKTDVWLYVNGDGVIVGFGSLGTTLWKFGDNKKVAVSIIPNVAVEVRFHGMPSVSGETKYSHQILSDLIGEAQKFKEARPYLGLYVDPRNKRAVQFYTRFQFIRLPTGYKDYDRMYLQLRDGEI